VADARCSSFPTSGRWRSDLNANNTNRPRGLRELDDLDAVFGALSHNTRRHILQVMHARGGTMTAGELASRFSHSWPTTTRHLRVLMDAGLVTVQRRGRERHYLLQRDRLAAILNLWLPSVGL
jgi:DNA-binding transcriptional ArsR family regulator